MLDRGTDSPSRASTAWWMAAIRIGPSASANTSTTSAAVLFRRRPSGLRFGLAARDAVMRVSFSANRSSRGATSGFARVPTRAIEVAGAAGGGQGTQEVSPIPGVAGDPPVFEASFRRSAARLPSGRTAHVAAHPEGLDRPRGSPSNTDVGAVRDRVHPRLVMTPEEILAETTDPHGERVVLLRRVWEGKVLRDHAELGAHLADVLRTVAEPDHVASDRSSFERTRYYSRDVGPSRWLLVVVSYEQQPARIITALANRKDPKRWKP